MARTRDIVLGASGVAGLLLSGCAQLTTFNDKEDLGSSSVGVFIDAKQRAVLTSPVVESRDGASRSFQRFCAEPSPDALSALAANLGVGVNVSGKGSLDITQGLSEGAANIGLRTAAVQSLRDITYRDCEAFVNGGMTNYGLETLQRRFQSTLVAILAIEQLTGAVQSAPIAITSQSKSGDAESLAKIAQLATDAQARLDEAIGRADSAKASLDEAIAKRAALQKQVTDGAANAKTLRALSTRIPAQQAELDAYDKAVADLAAAETRVAAAQTASDKAAADQALRQRDVDGYAEYRRAAVAAGGASATSAQWLARSASWHPDAESIAAVANAVQGIVASTLELGFGREVCASVIGAAISRNPTTPANDPSLAACLRLIDQNIVSAQAQDSVTKARAGLYESLAKRLSVANLSASDFSTLIAALGNLQERPVAPASSGTTLFTLKKDLLVPAGP